MDTSAIHRRRLEVDEDEVQPHYGEVLSRIKQKDELLCLNVNLNGLPRHPNNPKERMLQKLVLDYSIDVLGCSEVNLNWSKLRHQDYKTSKGWYQG